MAGKMLQPRPAATISLMASTLPSSITGLGACPASRNHWSMITRVLAAGSNSTSSRLARKAGVMRAGRPVSRLGITATNSSFSIGMVTSAWRCTGKVTCAISMVLPSTALTKSAVLPVLASTLRLGKRTRKEHRMCGSRYRHAVAPVPSATLPA